MVNQCTDSTAMPIKKIPLRNPYGKKSRKINILGVPNYYASSQSDISIYFQAIKW